MLSKRKFGNTNIEVTPIGLGTWVFGGWPWRQGREVEFEKAVAAAIEAGINLIDTSPIYGCGRAEEIVGRVLKRMGARKKIILATKCGLSWENGLKKVWHDASRKAVLREIDESLKRLQTEYIDIYQIHWPDEKTVIGETMETMAQLKEKGKIRVIGVSNFNVAQIGECLKYAPLESLQPPFNYFQQESAKEILPFCKKNQIGTLTYGTLCKGLLTGKFNLENRPSDAVRKESWDSIFGGERYQECLKELERIKLLANQEGISIAQWAIRWATQQPGVACALVGARNAKQVLENAAVV